jgi:hypothetical protein
MRRGNGTGGIRAPRLGKPSLPKLDCSVASRKNILSNVSAYGTN